MLVKPVPRHVVANNAMRISEKLLEHYAIKETPTVQDTWEVMHLVHAVLVAKCRWTGELSRFEFVLIGICSRYFEIGPGSSSRKDYCDLCEIGGIRAARLAHSYYDAACAIHPAFAADLMDIDE